MKQIRYLISALLLLLFLILGIAFISLLSDTRLTDQKSLAEDVNPNPLAPLNTTGRGQMIFQQNCSSCHSLYKVVTGPALAGVEERGPWKDRENLVKWIHNPISFMRKNAYTGALQKQYSQIMPSFPDLSIEEIYDLLDYIKSQSGKPVPMIAIP